MRVGLKVDVESPGYGAYEELVGDGDVPARLADLGIEAVEIPLDPDSDLTMVGAAVRRFGDAGLRVSYHPYTEGTAANPAYFEGNSSPPAVVHRRFFTHAAQTAQAQGETVVNIHPAAAATGVSRRTLVARSVRFFDWARGWCADRAPGVVPVAELQVAPLDGEAVIRIGDSPEELEKIVTGGGVPACWDVGHAVWNHRRFGTRLEPTVALWRRIGHVHCHDVDAVDHRVPRDTDAPWGHFLEQLSATGFEGTVIIEVTAPTFLESGGATALRESIAAVADAIGRGGPHD